MDAGVMRSLLPLDEAENNFNVSICMMQCQSQKEEGIFLPNSRVRMFAPGLGPGSQIGGLIDLDQCNICRF